MMLYLNAPPSINAYDEKGRTSEALGEYTLTKLEINRIYVTVHGTAVIQYTSHYDKYNGFKNSNETMKYYTPKRQSAVAGARRISYLGGSGFAFDRQRPKSFDPAVVAFQNVLKKLSPSYTHRQFLKAVCESALKPDPQ
jgi:hypothetical protein